MRFVICLVIILVAGCSKQESKPAKPVKAQKKEIVSKNKEEKKLKPKPGKDSTSSVPSTAAQIRDRVTGKTAVDQYLKAKKELEEINKKQQERLDKIKDY